MAWTSGDKYVFNSANTNAIYTTALDNTHVAIIYQDSGNSGYGTAIIGTISNDDEISYGTEYVFNSGDTTYLGLCKIDSTHFAVVYRRYIKIATVSNGNELSFSSASDFGSGEEIFQSEICFLDSTHLAIAFANGSTNGKSLICTLDGSYNISLGSKYIFESGFSLRIFDHQLKLCKVDSTHYVIAYLENASGGASLDHSRLATVSNGNELSFSSDARWSSSTLIDEINLALVDSTHFIVSYRRNSKTWAVVGTISSGSISYGTQYESIASDGLPTSICMISSTQFFLLFPQTWGVIKPGTISNGNQISFGTTVYFNTASTDWIESCVIDDKHINIVFRNTSNSYYGTAIIYYNPDIILQFDATIDYSLDYSFSSATVLETTALFNYDYDIESDTILKSSISSPINYDIDYSTPITGSSSFNSIINYDYDWASWYEWDGKENRSYSSIRLVNSSYSIGKKQDNRNSKAQITASGLTPAQLQSLANTIPTLEDSKQSRGK